MKFYLVILVLMLSCAKKKKDAGLERHFERGKLNLDFISKCQAPSSDFREIIVHLREEHEQEDCQELKAILRWWYELSKYRNKRSSGLIPFKVRHGNYLDPYRFNRY